MKIYNEVSKRKSTSRAKLKEERIRMWKEHFKNLLGNSPKVTDRPLTKIVNNKLDIKPGQFIKKELNVVLAKIKNRKAAGLDETLTEVRKTYNFDFATP